MSKSPFDPKAIIAQSLKSGLFGQNNFKPGDIDFKTGQRTQVRESDSKESKNDVLIHKSAAADDNENREVVDLTGHADEIRLFVVQSLTGVLKALMKRIHSEASSAIAQLRENDIVLRPNAYYESEYEVNITEIHKIVFDIRVNGDLSSIITMRKSDAKAEIANFHKMDVDEVVSKFIKDADVLEVLYE